MTKTAAHTSAPWFYEENLDTRNTYSIHDDAATTIAQVERWNGDNDPIVMAEAEANARLIAAAPLLLNALEASEHAIEEATDIMHYEDGQPVTALEGSEIERAYVALCSALVEVNQALTAVRGQP
jgi:hypothetical protein